MLFCAMDIIALEYYCMVSSDSLSSRYMHRKGSHGVMSHVPYITFVLLKRVQKAVKAMHMCTASKMTGKVDFRSGF